LLLLGTLTTLPAQSSSRFVLASVVDPQSDTPLGGLAAEDFIIQEGSTPCETIAAKPAGYPIAILVDTSNVARPEFTQMRKAVRQLVSRLSGRDVAIYTFGDRAFASPTTRETPASSSAPSTSCSRRLTAKATCSTP
jgi:hypothetical protein